MSASVASRHLVAGQRLTVTADSGHDAVLTPATAFQGGATIITFADVATAPVVS